MMNGVMKPVGGGVRLPGEISDAAPGHVSGTARPDRARRLGDDRLS